MDKVLTLSKTKTQCCCPIREYNVFAINEDSTVIIGIVSIYSTPKSIIFDNVSYFKSYTHNNTNFEIFRNHINDDSIEESTDNSSLTECKVRHVIGETYIKGDYVSWYQKHNNFKIIDSEKVTQTIKI